MFALWKKKSVIKTLKEIAPALIILLITLVVSAFISEFTFAFGLKALWKIIFRFLRLSFLLTLPLFLLPVICSLMQGFFNRGSRQLIQVHEGRASVISPLKNWVLRPLQGIGLSLLIATKLLTLLGIYTGNKITIDTVLPSGQFSVAHFFGGTVTGIAVSLLLSCLWTLDDLGIRHYNTKTREARMIGKYLGLLLPIFFGFYGIIKLFDNNSQVLVAQYIAQMVIVLYPPFVVFNVLQSRYLKSHEAILLGRLKLAPEDILTYHEKIAVFKD
jgi:heme A synthase